LSADFVTVFATGWPEKPTRRRSALTAHQGVQNFAFTKEHALLVAKTMRGTATRLDKSKARQG